MNIDLKYNTDTHHIIEDFYLPVLKNSILYKRAVGYFSSEILVQYMLSLKDFYLNNGKMKLIISPHLSAEDIQALDRAYESRDQITSNALHTVEEQFLKYLSGDENLKTSAELFFLLIVYGVLEVKIAIPKNKNGLFHEKIGVFHLLNGEKIAISGSNNETYRSVSVNHESFNTFCSWKDGQSDYLEIHEQDFDRYWENQSDRLEVLEFREDFVQEVIGTIDTDKSLEERFETLENNLINKGNTQEKQYGLDFTPYDYQESAAQILVSKKRGILEFATGSGKTKTAIFFMELIKRERSSNFFVIVVPDKTLLEQWSWELQMYNDNVLNCYSDNPNWLGQFRTMIDIYKSPIPSNQVVVVTNQTMFRSGEKSRFLKQFKKLDGEAILIVDELHNWSTKLITSNLPKSEYRVGLSATPFNDPMTSYDKKLEQYFGGVVAEYDLGDAIKDGKLVPYYYYPVFVQLTEREKEEYRKISQKIASIQSMYEKEPTEELKKSLELMRFKRSRILYGASNKIEVLGEKLKESEISQENLLIYCGATNYIDEDEMEQDVEEDALTQLEAVNLLLDDLDIKSAQYTQKESSLERAQNIELFTQQTFTTLSAIKCLDEGVDIPQIENAVILASSSNKREFVQRRGRVLRRSPGKKKANIYDFVVFDEEDINSHINKIERARVLEFASLALNYDELKEKYKEYLEGDIYG